MRDVNDRKRDCMYVCWGGIWKLSVISAQFFYKFKIMLDDVSHRMTHTVWYYLYVETKEMEIIETQSRIMAVRVWEWGKWKDVPVKLYEPAASRWISSGTLTYSMLIIVKLLYYIFESCSDLKGSHHKKRGSNYVGW